MEALKVFESEEFGSVRTMAINGNVWFVGNDIAEILGYSNPRDAISKHVDDEDKGVAKCDTLGGSQNLAIINESGLYSLVLSSKLPTAKKFKHWVTSEILPSIRQNGAYIAGQESMDEAELLAKALIAAQNVIKRREESIERLTAETERMRPKEIFADAVSTSQTSILIGDLAKLICQNGVQIGQKRLFEWLRKQGYLMAHGASRNMPCQRYVEQGLFEVKESNIQNPDGSVRITKTTKVTGKGQIYFVNKFIKSA